jgi:membrane-associated phospholipid phosphatase
MYRGEHHPTDVLGSLIFSALWLTATTLLIKPNADARPQASGTAHTGSLDGSVASGHHQPRVGRLQS